MVTYGGIVTGIGTGLFVSSFAYWFESWFGQLARKISTLQRKRRNKWHLWNPELRNMTPFFYFQVQFVFVVGCQFPVRYILTELGCFVFFCLFFAVYLEKQKKNGSPHFLSIRTMPSCRPGRHWWCGMRDGSEAAQPSFGHLPDYVCFRVQIFWCAHCWFLYKVTNLVVASKISLILTPTWGDDPIWRASVSDGLKPPTSKCLEGGQSTFMRHLRVIGRS